jgi:hypothetical protein
LKLADALGFFVGGTILKDRLYFSSAVEYDRYRSRGDPQWLVLPTPELATQASGAALRLLQSFPAPDVPHDSSGLARVLMAPTESLNQLSALPRADYVSRGGLRSSVYRTPSVMTMPAGKCCASKATRRVRRSRSSSRNSCGTTQECYANDSENWRSPLA